MDETSEALAYMKVRAQSQLDGLKLENDGHNVLICVHDPATGNWGLASTIPDKTALGILIRHCDFLHTRISSCVSNQVTGS
jgi:hypothetical protein